MKTSEPRSTTTTAKSNSGFFAKENSSNFFGSGVKEKPFFPQTNNGAPIQAKLSIGQPNDKYEQEADNMADKVVQRLSTTDIPTKSDKNNPLSSNKKEGALQQKPVAPVSAITTVVQTKCESCEHEEKLQKKENDEDADLSGGMLQKKPIFESNAEPPEDGNQVQRKCAACEQEEKLQKKAEPGAPTSSAGIESSLAASKGSGTPLPAATREQMEGSFGVDFSNVRIHTGSAAVLMNKDLNAHAFTNGNDIYFNSGKYDTKSKGGQHLLAHELTHTVQQGAAIQRKKNEINTSGGDVPNIQRAWYNFRIPGTDYVFDPSIQGIKNAAGIAVDMGVDVIRAIINRVAPGVLDFIGNAVDFIKTKITNGIDALTGGLFSRIQSQGLAGILAELFGEAFASIGSGITAGCAALARAAKKLFAFAKKLIGPAIKAFKELMHKIGGFLSDLWNDFGQPAWDAIKKYAGKAWDWITEKATWLWNVTEPIRTGIAKAWKWLKEMIGLAAKETVSFLDWIKEKAAKAWNWVKEKIQPIIGPLKAIAAVLVMISPAGPIIAIWYGAPHIWKVIKWLAENFNKYIIVKAKEFFYNHILPLIKSGLGFIQSLINSGMTWISNLFTSLGNAITSLLNALGTLPVFRLIKTGIQKLASGLQRGINYIKSKAIAFGKWVSTTATRIWNFLEPIRELLRNLLVIGLLGPYAILDDGVWAMLVHIVTIGLKIPCIRELEGLLQVPHWIEKISQVRQTLKDAWFMMTHPAVLEAKAKAFLEPYIKQIPGKSESVLTAALAKVGLATSKHLAGILKYLVPAVTHLVSNWWPEVKKMLWYLIWPFGEGSPLYTDGPKLWKLVPGIWSNLWHGNFAMARDGFLEWMQALNNVVGIFAGWIAIGGALIGAIVGAFAGGVGAIPGAGAGFQIGLEIGEGIMMSMIITEGLVLASSVYDLITVTDDGVVTPPKPPENAGNEPGPAAGQPGADGPAQRVSSDVHTGRDRIEYAYQRIANSSITLGIMGVFILLGAIGGEIAEALMSVVKDIGEAVGKRLPGLANFLSETGEKISQSKLMQGLRDVRGEFESGRKMGRDMMGHGEPSPNEQRVKTTTPEGDPLGTLEGKEIKAEMDLGEGHEAKVLDDGQCGICSDPCKPIRSKFREQLEADPQLEAELRSYEDRLKNNPADVEAINGQRNIHNELVQGQVERVSPRVKEMEQRIADGDRTITKEEFKQYQRDRRLLDDSMDKIRQRYERLNPHGELTDEQIRNYLEEGKRLDEETGRFGEVDKTTSLRREYMGDTPGKDSATGKKVMDRMNAEKRMRNYPPYSELTEFLDADGNWYNAKSQADMGHHPIDAVDYWNTTGKYKGARSAEVREWMLNPDNYELEFFSRNRSEGASSGKRYDPPVK